jgi:hypothetical protein
MTYPVPPQGGVYAITKPGMSGAEHVVHVIVSLLTCLFWLPVYLLIFLTRPVKRVEVMAPYGTPPDVIEAARRDAMQLTPDEQATTERRRNSMWLLLVVTILPVGLCVLVTINR